jgi:RNA polymerase sigma-B factor
MEVFAVRSISPTHPHFSRLSADSLCLGLNRQEATEQLLLNARDADPEERTQLLDEVVRRNMKIAGDVAHRYRGRGIGTDDLQQVAYLGLVKAVQAFDPAKGANFLGFAVPTIRGELRRHFRDHGWVVRPPRSVQELQARITACEADLYQELGRSPRPSEIAERLEVDLDLVLDSLAANGCFVPSSLDAPTGDGEGQDLGERLKFEDPGFSRAEAKVVLQPLMRELNARDQLILELRFFRGWTQAEIGREIGVTQMQVSRLLSGILQRLRQAMGQRAA